jgi:hypothetical protein
MPATYRNSVDWDATGDYTTTGDNVTDRSLDERTPVTIRYGRDQARQFSPTSPGQMAYELDNRSGDYSPENASSPLAGKVLPNRPVQLQATFSATTYTLYTGYLDNFQLKPAIEERSIDVTCVDALGRLQGVTVSTEVYQGIRTGDAINYVLDAAGWPTTLRDIDAGVSYLPFWWAGKDDAFSAIMKLADSDGSAALITVDPSGRIVFRDRHHRLTRSASLTSQATWRSSVTEPVISAPVTYDHGWQEIINFASVPVSVRSIASDASVVWSTPGLLTIAPGDSLEIEAGGSSAFINAITPTTDVDYTEVSGSVTGVSLSRRSGASTVIKIRSLGGVTIQDLQLRAYPLNSTDVTVTVQDTTSISQYGPRSIPTDRLPEWTNIYDAQAILQTIVGKRSQRVPTITVTMRGAGGTARLNECLNRDLSDRVHVTESLTGLDSDCFIEQIQHQIGAGGSEHVTTFGVEKIPTQVTNPLTFDKSGAGFDQGAFAQMGQDNPSTLFRLDTSGQGFDQGLFAY